MVQCNISDVTDPWERLRAVDLRLQRLGVEAKAFPMVGSSAMVLAYNASRISNQLDGIFEPRDVVFDVAGDIAGGARDIGARWLSDAVTRLVGHRPSDGRPREQVIGPALTMEVAPARYLLAMKTMAAGASGGDLDDAAYLCRMSGVATPVQLADIVRRYFGAHPHFDACDLLLERILVRASR